MSRQRTFYEVFGIEATATPEEVKQRYRQLAKRYHPDAVPPGDGAAAHRAFVELTEAYEVLGDPRRRESYDRELELQRQRRVRMSQPRPRPGPSGQHATGPPPAGAAPPPRAAPPPTVEQILHDARVDLARGRLSQAEAGCAEILRRDPRHAAAYSLLGEICRTQGRIDESIRYFMKAVQSSVPSAARASLRSETGFRERLSRRGEPGPFPRSLWPVVVVGCLVIVGLLVLPLAYPGVALGVWPVSEWTDSLLLAMGAASLIAGFLLSVTGLLGRHEDDVRVDLIQARGRPVPAWVVLLPTSLVFFPLALGVYCVAAALSRARPGMSLRLLATTAAAVLLFALVLPPAQGQTLLLGGNVVFPCVLIGSFAGVLFRDGW